MTRNQIIRFAFVLLVSFSTAFIGCSGSGDSTSSTPTAALNVLPSDYDFGTVTEGNDATPRQFEIQNNGTADLRVTSIDLSGTDAAFFNLNENGGADPCGSLNPTIDPGGSCTVSVEFDPTDGFRAYSAALVIQSNDPNTPTSSLTLDGAYAPIDRIDVTISQIDACADRDETKVYVSVTDQVQASVTTLVEDDFELVETPSGGAESPVASKTLEFVDSETIGLSVSLVMDYSQSILWVPGAVADMESAAQTFITQMNGGDEAEIIKYAAERRVMQAFTADPGLLEAAIKEDPGFSGGSQIYDALELAIANLSVRTNERKAVILLTDGREFDSDATGVGVVAQANANGISVYTVGFGDTDPDTLQDLADLTGGIYYESDDSTALEAIYVKLADLLFQNQYILTYDSDIAIDNSGELEVTVDYNGLVGSDTVTIPTCP